MRNIQVDLNKCVHCNRICVDVCYENVFSWDSSRKVPIVKHPEYCEVCNWCALMCPGKAINVIPIWDDYFPKPLVASKYAGGDVRAIS